MSTMITTNTPRYNTKNRCYPPSQRNGVFGTFEWASANANFINGCKHNCKYCYSKEMAIRFGRKTPENWENEHVRVGSLNKKIGRVNGTIMFPSSHDIHPNHLNKSLIFLENLLTAGNKVLIVTKPHLECIQAICEEFFSCKENILFRFTIGSADSKILKFWEPGAPNYMERLASLRWAHNKGFQTSISCEPMLDNNIEEVIDDTILFVTDAIWIGRANFLLRRLKLNGENDINTLNIARQLIEQQNDEYIMNLYYKFVDNPKIKWKESIKRVVGLQISAKKGLDI